MAGKGQINNNEINIQYYGKSVQTYITGVKRSHNIRDTQDKIHVLM